MKFIFFVSQLVQWLLDPDPYGFLQNLYFWDELMKADWDVPAKAAPILVLPRAGMVQQPQHLRRARPSRRAGPGESPGRSHTSPAPAGAARGHRDELPARSTAQNIPGGAGRLQPPAPPIPSPRPGDSLTSTGKILSFPRENRPQSPPTPSVGQAEQHNLLLCLVPDKHPTLFDAPGP